MSSYPNKAPSSANHKDSKEGRDGNDEAKKPSKSARGDVELDVSKLHSLASEQQDLYLFNFTTGLEKHIQGLNSTTIRTQQGNLKKELLQIITLQTPTPTRVVRRTIGRCFARIFTKGDRKLLFETVRELGDLLNLSKGDRDLKNKHAAVYCLGKIYKVAGDGVINLSSVICAALLKLYKSSTNHVSIRAVICKTLGKIAASVSGSLDESVARDIWKQSRGAASGDRGALVQINACWCLEQLISGTSYFDNTSDFDSLKSTIWKVGDSTVPAVRHASASCLASIMVKGYSETGSVVPIPKTPLRKRPKKVIPGQNLAVMDGDDSDSMRLASPTWKKNPLHLELTLLDILRQLSAQYVRPSTTNRGRAGIIACYSKVFRSLDVRIVESSFGFIAEHLLVELLSNTVISHHRYRLLLTRRFAQKLLADVIGRQILGESAQISCAKILINETLKNYPAVLKEKPEPSKNTLTGALNVLASFIQLLGSAFGPIADTCRDALIQVLQHPSYTVQIHASYCLRLFALACPQQIIQCASICMNSVTRELSLIGTDRLSARKSVGYANGLSAILSISGQQPLYSSLEISSRVLTQATNLLKSSVNEDLRVSGTQVQVAWVLIGGLMSLGPNFVKIHLSQLLLLWRNALPKALAKENAAQRQAAELSYLVHVRECALGSILSFLEYNSRLLTADISKRIAALLQNTIEFLDGLPQAKNDAEMPTRITPSLQLFDLVQMVRRRVLQCFTRLATRSPHTSKEILSQANLLAFAVSCFTEPEAYPQSSLGASIASSAANFDGIWTVADNSGYGISGHMRGLEIKSLPGEQDLTNKSHWHRQIEPPGNIDSLILSPVCGAREHDSVYMHLLDRNGIEELPDPPATEVVNSAIAMFAMALPLQEPKVQESALEQMSLYMAAKVLQRDPGRKAAITVNVSLALLGALKVSLGETSANSGDLKSMPVEKCLDDLLRTLIIDHDKYIRNAAYEALGRLCNGSGNMTTTTIVNSLVDTIVSNREPNARAGCAMALASIHSSVGGMAAGFHLRKIHGILMSLCSDPHPTVHFWAIEALSKVAESAGLTFSGYMPSTLGLLAQLWISDTHCEETDAIGTSNAELEMPTPAAIAHTIASLINVLGPDLQDMSKARDLILTLVRQFDLDSLPMVQGQALECWESIYLYAPNYVDYSKYVHQLQKALSIIEPGVHEIAVDGLYSLMRRDAVTTLRAAADGIEDQIWGSFDNPEDQNGIRSIVEVWMSQTGLTHTAQWIARCQDILTKTVAKAEAHPPQQPQEVKNEQNNAPTLQDEEVAGFDLGDTKDEDGGSGPAGQELLRWQIRAFALQCLSSLFNAGAKELQAHPDSAAGHVLQNKVADIIRMAFLASTSSVVELRIGGLRLIDQVLTLFGRTPDPDFSEALLLEQYQAQISSALTPAFGADSTPELASAAINVCATFIATGLVTDVDRMGRILKLLVSSLTSFTVDSGDPSVGELKGLSSNAQRMVKMAVLSAWAELQVASTEQGYLVEVVRPHVARLTPLWLSSLQDFARLRFEPDISSSMGINPDDSLDTIYAALNRQTLLKFYQDSWLTLVDAIASLIDQDSDFVFDALDGKVSSKSPEEVIQKNSDINYRDEPVAFFFVLYGIAFEALITRPSGSSQDEDQTLEILLALKKILRPSVSGHAIYQDIVFSETMDVLDRLAQTEGLAVQAAIVEITRNLCLSHPSVDEDAGDEHLSDDIEQLFELTRIIVLVLAGVLPNLGEKPSALRHQISEDAVSLITLSLDALVDAAAVFPSIIRTDLHACIIHIFATILGTGACQAHVVPKALVIFKRFIQSLAEDLDENPSITDQLRICLQKFRSILFHAQRRESEASLHCARNTLMASVILLTNGASGIPVAEPLVPALLSDLLDCLGDVGLGKVAASCARSLLLQLDPTQPTGQAIARFLLPRLLHFVAAPTSPAENAASDPEDARPVVLHALVAHTGALQGGARAAALCAVLPVIVRRATVLGRETYADAAGRLLAAAALDQAAFKGVVGAMSSEQRAMMEEVIREGGGVGRDVESRGGEREGPSIALKLNFG